MHATSFTADNKCKHNCYANKKSFPILLRAINVASCRKVAAASEQRTACVLGLVPYFSMHSFHLLMNVFWALHTTAATKDSLGFAKCGDFSNFEMLKSTGMRVVNSKLTSKLSAHIKSGHVSCYQRQIEIVDVPYDPPEYQKKVRRFLIN